MPHNLEGMEFFIELKKDIEETKSLLKSLIESQHQNIKVEYGEQVLNVDECAAFLSLSKATIYSKISKGDLPTIKKAKRCYFLKSDLIEYLKKDRVSTNDKIKDEIDQFFK